jgi:prepilin-type N-terminal cleavage/methylation domain-containing protein
MTLRNQRGLTLPEVLASMVVLSLGILGLAPMMAVSIDGSVLAENVTTVVSSAQEKVEAMLAEGMTEPVPYTDVELYDGGKYTITTVVTDATVDTIIPDHVYKIDVSVAWTEKGDLNRSMGFVTYMQKP